MRLPANEGRTTHPSVCMNLRQKIRNLNENAVERDLYNKKITSLDTEINTLKNCIEHLSTVDRENALLKGQATQLLSIIVDQGYDMKQILTHQLPLSTDKKQASQVECDNKDLCLMDAISKLQHMLK
ncbi:uncharacterized protein [Periplaneta americana]|uniref:uncharacterized protein n=1 Tax=Periplaneta americana TaxID=6978 RepID=UPI0037E72D4C